MSQPLVWAPERARAATPSRPEPGVRVVLGAIDRGGAPLNRAWARPDAPERTRLLSYWDQGRTATADDAPWQVPPAGYGRELTREALDRLGAHTAGDPARELALYRAWGLDELVWHALNGTADHATHVLDTLGGPPSLRPHAASAKPGTPDAAAAAPLVLVSVPAGHEGQTTGAAAVAQVVDAVHHILAEARAVAPDAPVVVNLSLGVYGGPHDGRSALEQALDALMRAHPHLLVVVAAGNGGADHLLDPSAVTNAGGWLAPGERAEWAWRLQPRDPTDSFLEAWFDGAPDAEPAWCVLQPWASPWVGPGQRSDLRDPDTLLGRLQLQALGAGRWRGQCDLAPTAGARGGLPAGCWRLAVRNTGRSPLRVALRVQGDLPRWTDPELQQSVLAEATGLALGGAGTMNGLATGHCPVPVGAVRLSDGLDALYTAQPAPGRPPVTVRAAADEAPLAYGLVAAGALSGSEARMGGTSVAAPVAARRAAQRLADGERPAGPTGWRAFLQPPDERFWRP
jgi:hypothetical protein